MLQSITACFDGKSIVPDQPLQLPLGQRLRVQIEVVEQEPYPLARIASLATDMGIDDLAERHREHARGRP